MHGIERGVWGGGLNPAGSLMISLCPKYELHGCECAYSCVLSQILELKCVHIGAPMSICAYVYSLGTRLAFYVVGANGSDGFREKSL